MRPSCVAVFLALSTLASVNAGARTRAVHSPRPVPQAAYGEGGYASAASVAQGGLLEFHIATAVSPFPLQIVNLATPDTVLQTLTLESAPRDCTGLSAQGCQWPVTAIFAVPASWPSGYYAARFPTSLGTRNVFFLVREDHPGSTSPMAVVVATNTYQAYNTYGYKSVYPSDSPERSYRVSFDRPYHDVRGLGRFSVWDKPFLEWLTSEHESFEVISDSDLEDPTILNDYQVAVIAGHSEYWTAAARAQLERFVDRGGRVAILGGNTMWWQARVENRALVVYKAAAPDPENGRNDAVVTVNWFAEPVLRPENLITGLSFRNGGYTNLEAPQYGYTVTDASHWIFGTTGVSNGTHFGNVAAGDETDGALYNCTMNGLEVDGSDGTPLNFRILATVPAAEGHGTVGIYTTPTGGGVFNAGSQDWVLGLATDPIVRLMTRNVLDRFREGRLPYEPVTSNVRMRELFNCALDTTEEKIVPGWRGEEGGLVLSERCAAEGAAGLELTGTQRILIRRGFAPTGNTMSRAELNFSLNADASSGPASAQLSLVTLQVRKKDVASRAARVEFQPSTKSVRLVLFNANNAATAIRTDWVPLTSGWNTIRMAWQSPGDATLRVNGGEAKTVVNPLADQSVGEVLIAYDQPSMSGSLCVDALSVQ
jgi:hypothetical protein